MSAHIHARQPRGTPVGGQFAAAAHLESNAALDHPHINLELLERRHQLLAVDGYVPPLAVAAIADPADPDQREDWWAAAAITAEHADPASGQTPQMPSDFTESGRRVPLTSYEGSKVNVRMPAAASVRRFAAAIDATFDMPVSATYPGGSVAGWVRVTPTAGRFHVTGLGFSPEAEAHVPAAVAAVLEARRVTHALEDAAETIEARRRVEAPSGDGLVPVKSSWLAAVGYDPDSNTMVVAAKNGRVYGYHVDEDTYQAVATSPSPGAAYNKLVKGSGGTAVDRCGRCGRWSAADSAHTCPLTHTPAAPGAVWDQNLETRSAAEALTRPTPGSPPPPPPAPEVGVDLAGHHRHLGLGHTEVDGNGQPVPHRYGRRGWTRALLDDIAPHTTSRYLPGLYASGGTAIRPAGVAFDGLNAASAAAITSKMSERALTAEPSRPGAPRVGAALAASAESNGAIELGGWLVGPDRATENVTVHRIWHHVDTDSPDEAWESLRAAVGDPAMSTPHEMRRVDVPWRPGRQAWLARW